MHLNAQSCAVSECGIHHQLNDISRRLTGFGFQQRAQRANCLSACTTHRCPTRRGMHHEQHGTNTSTEEFTEYIVLVLRARSRRCTRISTSIQLKDVGLVAAWALGGLALRLWQPSRCSFPGYLDTSAFHVVLISCTRELSIDVYSSCSAVVLSILCQNRRAEFGVDGTGRERGETERESQGASCTKNSYFWFRVF